MLEVVGDDRDRGEVVVMAGLGRAAEWYRNLLAGQGLEVAIGATRFRPDYRVLEPPEAAAMLAAYERRNRLVAPIVRRVLSWLVGWTYDGGESARRRLVEELPLVALRPATDRAGQVPVPTDSGGPAVTDCR